MKVFHGSTEVIEKPSVAAGRDNLDFGKGFYLTDLEQQAILWVTRPRNASKRKYVNVYEFDLNSALKTGARYRKFSEYDEQWLTFIASNRRGGNEWKQYDIIEGGIANDRIFTTLELYMTNLISMEEALQRLIYEKPNNQICILNQSIIDNYLRFETANEITV